MAMDPNQTVKYIVGALLIIAGAALFYMNMPTYGMGLVALGLGVLGYSVGNTAGYKAGVAYKTSHL